MLSFLLSFYPFFFGFLFVCFISYTSLPPFRPRPCLTSSSSSSSSKKTKRWNEKGHNSLLSSSPDMPCSPTAYFSFVCLSLISTGLLFVQLLLTYKRIASEGRRGKGKLQGQTHHKRRRRTFPLTLNSPLRLTHPCPIVVYLRGSITPTPPCFRLYTTLISFEASLRYT